MTRLQQTVVLDPVPRAWFDQSVGTYFDVLTEYFTDSGDPPAAGAAYDMPDGKTTAYLESWQRDGMTAGRLVTADSGSATIVTTSLDSPANPRVAECIGDFRGREGWLSTLTGTVRVDLATWWEGAARKDVGPAITAHGKHAFGRVGSRVAVAPAAGGRWQVTVDVALHGRGVLRPLVSAVLFFTRRRINRTFAAIMTEFARGWHEDMPPLFVMSQDDLREMILTELAGATDA